jgi:hypothetical protein
VGMAEFNIGYLFVIVILVTIGLKNRIDKNFLCFRHQADQNDPYLAMTSAICMLKTGFSIFVAKLSRFASAGFIERNASLENRAFEGDCPKYTKKDLTTLPQI